VITLSLVVVIHDPADPEELFGEAAHAAGLPCRMAWRGNEDHGDASLTTDPGKQTRIAVRFSAGGGLLGWSHADAPPGYAAVQYQITAGAAGTLLTGMRRRRAWDQFCQWLTSRGLRLSWPDDCGQVGAGAGQPRTTPRRLPRGPGDTQTHKRTRRIG
jgi:hypothetical protein